MTLLPQPDRFFLVSGFAEGDTSLNAFDNALLAAGIGNTNLIRISSILPPACIAVEPLILPPGALVPIAYASGTSDRPGTRVSAAVACGLPEDPALPGIIMEHSNLSDAEACLAEAVRRVRFAFEKRGWALADVKTAVASGVVAGVGTAFAGVALWGRT